MIRPVLLLLCGFGVGFTPGADPAQAKLTPDELAARRQKIGDDPVRLLELVPLLDDAAASDLRRHIGKRLTEVPAAERDEVARKVALLLPAAVRSPDDVQHLLGPPAHIARQAVYRRYVEQWIFDQMLAICVVWVAQRGQEKQLQSVQALSVKNR